MRTAAVPLVIACLLVTPVEARSQQCGDVDSNGVVTAGDALAVLKRAVGHDVPLTCTTGECAALEARVASLEASTLVAVDASGRALGSLVTTGAFLFGASYWDVKPSGTDKVLRLLFFPDESTSNALYSCESRDDGGLLNVVYFSAPDCAGQAYVEIESARPAVGPGFIRSLGYDCDVEEAEGSTTSAGFYAPVGPAPNGQSFASRRSALSGFACVPASGATTGDRFYTAAAVLPSFNGEDIPLPLGLTSGP